MKVHCKHERLVQVSDLKPFPNNPNRHSKEQVQRLADILKYQGWRRPVRVSKLSGRITAGHGAVEAAKLNGWTEVPVDLQEYENEDQEYADVVADNALHEWSGLGIDLSLVNSKVGELGPDFDIDLLGVENFTIDISEKLVDSEPEPELDESTIPKRVQSGDIWTCGRHRVMCGNSLYGDDVNALLDGKKIDLLLTDPPYDVAGNCEMAYVSEIRKNYRDLQNSEWDKDFDITPFLKLVFEHFAESYTAYIFSSQFVIGRIFDFVSGKVDHYSSVIWCKPNPMPCLSKTCWIYAHELIAYFYRKPVFNFPPEGHALSWWEFNVESHSEGHPTQKPVKLMRHPIVHSSAPGAVVADFFLGSGTTMIACEETGRTCLAMERDPHFCDVAITRWERLTGNTAVKI